MATKEIIIVSSVVGLGDALNTYDGVKPLVLPNMNRVASMITSEEPPNAVYIEDTRGTREDILHVVAAAQSRHIPVYIGIQGTGQNYAQDLIDAGMLVTFERDVASLSSWVAQQLGARKRVSSSHQRIVSIASGKGGSGKTTLLVSLAEALTFRSVRVLIVDGDISNSGVNAAFHVPSGVATYPQIKRDGASGWTPTNIRSYIYKHEQSGIDLLIGGDATGIAEDLSLQDFRYFMQGVHELDEYDVVLLDTGPELLRRPYAAFAVYDHGGYVIIPVPPGRKEREGAGNLLQSLAVGFPDRGDLSDHALLVLIEPEKDYDARVADIAPLFGRKFPNAKILGTMPRDPQLISSVSEAEQYVSALQVGPHRRLTRELHNMADALCQVLTISPTLPKPQATAWERLFKSRSRLQAVPQMNAGSPIGQNAEARS